MIKNTLENYISLYNQHSKNIGTELEYEEINMLTRIFDKYTKVLDDFLIHVLRTRDLKYALSNKLFILGDSAVDGYMNVCVDGIYVNYKF